MKITIEEVKEFAWQQMDGMWHTQTGNPTFGMVQFVHHGYAVVNPWMDEKTKINVDPYEYYGKQKTERFIEEAKRKMITDRLHIQLDQVNHFNFVGKDGQVFCKRQDKIRKIASGYKDCDKCPYLFGSLQGEGVECKWEDIVPPPSPFGYYVHDPTEEFKRVSSLIDEGILTKR